MKQLKADTPALPRAASRISGPLLQRQVFPFVQLFIEDADHMFLAPFGTSELARAGGHSRQAALHTAFQT